MSLTSMKFNTNGQHSFSYSVR